MKLFGPARMLASHRVRWEAEQAANNQEAIATGAEKVNFITKHGTKEQILVLQGLIAEAEQMANMIYMLPLGYDTDEFKPQQEDMIARLDALMAEVKENQP